jgi:hypothetical protein
MERLHRDGEDVLLIVDDATDADALKPSVARRFGRVFATSNSHAWRGVAEPIEIRLCLPSPHPEISEVHAIAPDLARQILQRWFVGAASGWDRCS